MTMLLLSLAASCTKSAPETLSTTDEACTPELRLSVDRDRGYLPLPVTLSAEVLCVEGEPSWDLGDGALGAGVEVEHTYLGSGTVEVSATLGELTETLTIEVRPAPCPEQLEAVQVGALQSDELDEASGLSHSPSGVLWTHNDSGDAPRLFALSAEGETLGTVLLDGAEEGDWEDSSRFVDPLSGEVTLYVGDVGDNELVRETIAVYALAEPSPSGDEQLSSDWIRLELSYPEGPRNAETLMVDPVTEDLYVVSDGGEVYRKAAPHVADTRTVMEWVADLDFAAMGGDISPQGDRIALRSLDEARIWLRDGSLPFAEAFAAEACALELPEEPRGESLAFDAEGRGLYTVSEELYQPIWYTGLVPVEQPCVELEAGILRSPDGELPLTVTFEVDQDCVPAGVAEAVWTFEDGEEQIGDTAERTWLASGTTSVALTVTDREGATATAVTTVTISPQTCPSPDEPVELGEVTDDSITEASGLALSAQDEGALWTPHDSGGEPELFAISNTGELLETVLLEVGSRDWEDLAYGWTDAGGWTIFVGDIGDNKEVREDIRVLLVPEDEPHAYGIMVLTYPGALAHNAESIAVDPQTGDLLVITKSYEGETSVFRKPPPHLDGDVVELTWVADLDTAELPFVGSEATTAMDFSPEGSLIGVRTYSHVWLFRRDAAESLAAAFSRTPCDGGAPSERQGEAIAMDGDGYYLLSEGNDQPLNYVRLLR
jgi:hypothetical protein